MELTVLFISVLFAFLFFFFVHERTRSTFSRITQLALYNEKGKMFLLRTLFGGKQYNIYGNFSHLTF